MKTIQICADYDDQIYNHALEKALLLQPNQFILGSKEDPQCIILSESFLSKYTPVSEIIQTIMAKYRQERPVKPQEEVMYTCFCSAIGGAGLSTTSLFYGRLQSEVFGKKIAYISFDPWFRKTEIHPIPQMGLTILSSWPCTLDVDELVIDLPFGAEGYMEILNMCDRRVVVTGYQENRREYGKRLFDSFEKSKEYYLSPPENYLFDNHFDQALDINDSFTQLGREVLAFAKKLQ